MKHIISLILTIAMVLSTVPCTFAENNVWREFYVSTSGSDTNDGSKSGPFKTLEKAKEAVEAVSDGMTGDIVVNVESGTYFLDKKLDFGTADSGKNGHNIIWSGTGAEKPVISGGAAITGFTESTENDGVWVADAAGFESILQLSVNGKRRYMAKNSTQIKGVTKSEKYDNEDWYDAHPQDERDNHYNYYDAETRYTYDGMYLSKRDFGLYENPQDILFVWNHEWTTCIVPVEEIEQDPDMLDQLRVRMKPGDYNFWVQGARNNNTNPKPEREFTAMNAMELLDEPGEFYFNRKTKKLYYIPEKGENMTTATVIAPKLECIMLMYGNDIDDKVENITFRNMGFMDSKWDYLRGMKGEQAAAAFGLRVTPIGFRGVQISYAKNINFYGNRFANIAGSAIDLLNACEDCEIVGNTFYDIGETAICAGTANHGDFSLGADGVSNPVPVEHKDDPVELVSSVMTRVDASSYLTDRDRNDVSFDAIAYPGYGGPDDNDNSGQYDLLHKSWFGDDSLVATTLTKPYANKWEDDTSVKKGEKPWVKFEFIRPYSINEIVVSFDPNCVTDAEKSNFEILASNDINFRTYDVLKTVGGTPSSDINRYTIENTNKYQYIMIRSLDSKTFAMSRVWITTKDKKPYVKNQRDKNITITNNYCERLGVDLARSLGLVVTHGENFKIKHNEFIDVGYSGMSIGYSWHIERNTCYNMDVSNNLVYDTTQAGHDGGGIYVLGPQPGSVYANNYINTVNQGINGFYTDNGSRYETITGNVITGATRILSPYTYGGLGGIRDNVFENNYSNHGIVADAAAPDNDYENPKIFPIGQPSEAKAYATITDAGLESQYKMIKDLVPEQRDNLPYKYELNYAVMSAERSGFTAMTVDGMSSELNNTLGSGKFGTGLGEMPLEYKYRLEKMASYLDGTDNLDFYMRYTVIREFERELQNSINRYSFEETLKLCEEKLIFAKGNISPSTSMGLNTCEKYPEEAVAEFESTVDEVKGKHSGALTTEEKFPLLLELENAYNSLQDKCNLADIEFVHINDATKVDIDRLENTVVVHMPAGSSTTVDDIDVKPSGNAIVAKILSGNIDISKPITIPIFCKGNSRYKIWKLSMEFDKPEDTENLSKASWIANSDEAADMMKSYNDGILLPAGEYIYMSKGYSVETGGGTVNFSPLSNNDIKSFKTIIGANTPVGQENKSTVQNRCEIEFAGDKAGFYKVKGTDRTLIASIQDSYIKYNERNTLSYKIEEINNNSFFKVWLNEELIFSTIIEKCSYGKYFGFYNRYMNIKINN